MANIEQSQQQGVTLLKLTGSLTFIELQEIQKDFESIVQSQTAPVVIDLANVDMLTTPAISMFLAAAKDLKSNGQRIVVSGPQPRVGEILKRLRLESILPICETIESGISRLNKQ